MELTLFLAAQIPPLLYAITNLIDKNLLKDRIISFGKAFYNEPKFENKRNKELKQLQNEGLSLKTHLRIKLPNKFIVDIILASRESIQTVFNILFTLLKFKETAVLFNPPLIKNGLTSGSNIASQKNLYDMDWSPNSILVFKYNNEDLNKNEELLLNQKDYM